MKSLLVIFGCAFALTVTGTGKAVDLFTEDFEVPDVVETGEPDETSKQRPDFWVVGSINPAQGYNLVHGADRQGIVDASNGAFTGSAGNTQAYAFRYTSSPQIVSDPSAFRVTLQEDAVYTLTFDVQQDLNDNENSSMALGYDAYIIAFDADANRAVKIGETGQHILGRVTGKVPAGPSFTSVTLSYTGIPADSAHFGKEVGIAFSDRWTGFDNSDPSSGVIDNVNFKVDRIPEPSAFALLGFAFGLGLLRRK